MFLPIEPHLIELLMAMHREGCQLIICGGLGIYLKHRWVAEQVRLSGRRCLFDPHPLPSARATDDIDALLSMQVFTSDGQVVKRYRKIIDSLGYDAKPGMEYLHFFKKSGDFTIKLELLSRLPTKDEVPPAKVRKIRVGRRGTSWDDLNAFTTPEAFAIEDGIQAIPFAGSDPHGNPYDGTAIIPHPFTSMCMKIKATKDCNEKPIENRQPRDSRHAFDVYLLMAMLDEQEREQVETYVHQYQAHSEFIPIQAAVLELFRTPDSPGCRTIEENSPENIHLDIFSELICELFAPSEA